MQTIRLDDIPRNAIPSLHSAWALLLFWSVRHCRQWIRHAAAVFLALTLLATLGLGEHYVIDLVVAVPFAAFVMAACAREHRRAAVLGALVMAWLAYLRFGFLLIAPAPALAWVAVLATLAVPLWRYNVKSLPIRTLKIPGSSGIPSARTVE